MPKGIGKQLSFGIAKEAVRGTAEAGAAYWIPWDEVDLNEKDQRVNDEQSYGVIEDSVGQTIVKQWAEGNWKAPIGEKHFPLVLYSILGTLNTADNADTDPTIKDHTITVQQGSQHQALTLFIDDPLAAQDYKHALGVVSGLEVNYEKGKLLSYSASVKSKKGATATLTPSITSENHFTHKHFTFKLATNLAGLSGASAQNIRSLTLKIDQSIEDDDILGSLAPADFLNKQFSIEGQVEAIWQNESDFKTNTLAGTAKAMRIDLKNTDIVIGSAANPQVQIDLAKVIFKEITRPVRVGDVVVQTVGFKAHYSVSDSKMVTILCVNNVASY